MRHKSVPEIDLDSLSALIQLPQEKKHGIRIISADGKSGPDIAREVLYEITDRQTLLFLAGGKTPSGLYSSLAREGSLIIGAAAMVDERYGKPWHGNSNELLIKQTGLLEYFDRSNIPFFRILAGDINLESTTRQYERTLVELWGRFHRSVAILGMGQDGHIAGIAPNRIDFTNPLFSLTGDGPLVSCFRDLKSMSSQGESTPPYGFGNRITLTFRGLARIDILIFLVLGSDKKSALVKLWDKGPLEQIPARFIKDKEISRKTILITDQYY